MKIVCISDLHLFSQGNTELFDQHFDFLSSYLYEADVFLIIGDIAQQGESKGYEHLKHVTDQFKNLDLMITVGNQDSREELYRFFPEHSIELSTELFFNRSNSFSEIDILVCDSKDLSNHYGTLCEPRLNWLRQTIHDSTKEQILIAMHHPVIATGSGEIDGMIVIEGRKDFYELIKRVSSEKKVYIISGHNHMSFMTYQNDILSMICPSFSGKLCVRKEWHGKPSYVNSANGFLTLDVDNRGLKAEFVTIPHLKYFE